MAITLAQLIYDAAVGKSERVNVSPQKITTEEEPGLFVCSPIYWLTDPLKSQFASVAASCIKYKFISDKEVEISILDGAFNAGKNLDNKSYFQGRVAINIKSEKHYSFKKNLSKFRQDEFDVTDTKSTSGTISKDPSFGEASSSQAHSKKSPFKASSNDGDEDSLGWKAEIQCWNDGTPITYRTPLNFPIIPNEAKTGLYINSVLGDNLSASFRQHDTTFIFKITVKHEFFLLSYSSIDNIKQEASCTISLKNVHN